MQCGSWKCSGVRRVKGKGNEDFRLAYMWFTFQRNYFSFLGLILYLQCSWSSHMEQSDEV